MKQYFFRGLAVVALLGIGSSVWSDATTDNAALAAAREKRTSSLRQVANDRTAIKTACGKKGSASACHSAQDQYKSDLAVYRTDEAAFRTAKGQKTASPSTSTSSPHTPTPSYNHPGPAHAPASGHH